MRVRLLARDEDVDVDPKGAWNAADLRQDLGLDTVLDAMAAGDEYLRACAEAVLLAPLTDVEAIQYRQDVFADCMNHADVVRQFYDLARGAIDGERKVLRGLLNNHPTLLLSRSVEVMTLMLDVLRKLRSVAGDNAHLFRSTGLTQLCAVVQKELDDDYLAEIERHLKRLRRRDRVVLSARLGRANKGREYVLRSEVERHVGLFAKMTGRVEEGYDFTIPAPDEAGSRALAELEDRGRDLVADALAQAVDHVLDFFGRLRFEAGFYLCGTNLCARLLDGGLAVCRPDPTRLGTRVYRAIGLYDVGLALRSGAEVVGNDVTADDRSLVLVTGANQGGKSTFLRSAGIAALMMQAGLFVGAKAYAANVASAIVTHYKREEDVSMVSGKFDEELARMARVVDHLDADGLLLSNESFSATNEAEAAQIATAVWHALLDSRVEVFAVTHLFELADSIRREQRSDTLFLRARRHDDGRRDFRVVPGEPLPTSFGQDLYEQVMGGQRS